MTHHANEAGHPKIFPLAHAARIMTAKLFLTVPSEFSRSFDNYRKVDYVAILENLIEHTDTGNANDISEKQQSDQAQASQSLKGIFYEYECILRS